MGKNPCADINDPPQITSAANVVAVETEQFSYHATAIDPDGTTPIITITDLPVWLTSSGATISGITPVGAVDTSFKVIASDSLLADTLLVNIAITAGGVPYATEIQPIFNNSCAVSGCHITPSPQAGLQLDSYAHVMQGSQNGQVIIPFDASGSVLIQRIDGSIPPSMPLNRTPLPDFSIQKIRDWISQGARDN
jgi:hypothetical protein